MSMPMSRVLALLLCLSLSACAGLAPRCPAGEQAVVNDTLYFGTQIPGGGLVDAVRWQGFIDEIITPRFPQGLTHWDALGQWKNQSGSIAHESSHVLQIAHPDTPQDERAITDIMAAYRERFHQEAVLRLHAPVCMGL